MYRLYRLLAVEQAETGMHRCDNCLSSSPSCTLHIQSNDSTTQQHAKHAARTALRCKLACCALSSCMLLCADCEERRSCGVLPVCTRTSYC